MGITKEEALGLISSCWEEDAFSLPSPDNTGKEWFFFEANKQNRKTQQDKELDFKGRPREKNNNISSNRIKIHLSKNAFASSAYERSGSSPVLWWVSVQHNALSDKSAEYLYFDTPEHCLCSFALTFDSADDPAGHYRLRKSVWIHADASFPKGRKTHADLEWLLLSLSTLHRTDTSRMKFWFYRITSYNVCYTKLLRL